MDTELDLRHCTVSLAGHAGAIPGCLLRAGNRMIPRASCTACPDLARLAIDAATPQGGSGCPHAMGRVHARLLSHTEAGQAGCRSPEGAALPRRQMLCPCLTPENSPQQKFGLFLEKGLPFWQCLGKGTACAAMLDAWLIAWRNARPLLPGFAA